VQSLPPPAVGSPSPPLLDEQLTIDLLRMFHAKGLDFSQRSPPGYACDPLETAWNDGRNGPALARAVYELGSRPACDNEIKPNRSNTYSVCTAIRERTLVLR
jgi:hypothetical protein